jgi:AraC-like DNA-binding protein/quercetin dioxygenase-like cupin family protein
MHSVTISGAGSRGLEHRARLNKAPSRAYEREVSALETGAPVERVTPELLAAWPLTVLHRLEEAGVRVWEIALAPGFVAPPHEHELPFFCVLLEGEMENVYSRGPLRYRRLQNVFHPAGTVHSGTAGPGGARILTLETTADWAERLDGLPALPCGPTTVANDDGPIVVRRLRRELRAPGPGSDLVIEGLALELLAAAMRAPAGERRIAAPAPRWLAAVLDRLRDDLATPVRLRDLAADAGVAPARLSAAFRRHTGTSVGEYRRALQVDWVRERLRDRSRRDEPIAEIALAAGFADQAHCTRVFKASTGWTPAKFRSHASSVSS